MRKILAVVAMLAVSGCASLIEGAYDEQARTQCEQARDRGDCHDRVDRNRRERDRKH